MDWGLFDSQGFSLCQGGSIEDADTTVEYLDPAVFWSVVDVS